MRILTQLLNNPSSVDSLFCKFLTKNDDSGRHGVVIPREVYSMFPSFRGPKSGDYKPISCVFTVNGQASSQVQRTIRYKFYHQKSHKHPERRLTCFKSKDLALSRPCDLLIVAKMGRTYEAHYISSKNSLHSKLTREFKLKNSPQGSYYYNDSFNLESFNIPSSLKELLSKFDKISKHSHRTVLSHDSGVGETFEHLLGVRRNNLPMPDFKGIEIKGYKLSSGLQPYDQDLFLKEPTWEGKTPGKKVTDIVAKVIRKRNYVDEHGRLALKMRVKRQMNSSSFSLSLSDSEDELLLKRRTTIIARWSCAMIQSRLDMKHAHVAFIGATATGKGASENFTYKTLTYCTKPSWDAFKDLLKKGYIWIELRMHLDGTGKLRNHGTQFRIKNSKLPSLFAIHLKKR